MLPIQEGRTALDWAVVAGHAEIVELFLVHPAIDVNAQDSRLGLAPMHLASAHGNNAVLRVLFVAPNVGINIRDHVRFPALLLPDAR